MKYITLVLVLLTTQAHANFAPANNVMIPVNNNRSTSLAAAGIDEPAFNAVITKVLQVYEPEFQSHGFNLIIKRLWSNPTANSNTDQEGIQSVINAFGGLARFPHMTADAYAMVLCHEVGHHLGGFPKSGLDTWRTNMSTHWASNEGESDYFSAMKCFRKLVINDSNNKFFNVRGRGVESLCNQKSPNESAVCIRTINAGIVLAGVLHSLAGKNEPFHAPSPNTPDTTQVSRTYDGHPNSQCRLDCYIAGAICPVDMNIAFSDKDPRVGACSEEAGDKLGVRNRCWYKPLTPKRP